MTSPDQVIEIPHFQVPTPDDFHIDAAPALRALKPESEVLEVFMTAVLLARQAEAEQKTPRRQDCEGRTRILTSDDFAGLGAPCVQTAICNQVSGAVERGIA